MRLFFGLELSPGTKAAIADWRDRYTVADGRPVPPANFHITLAFLGEVEEADVERLCDSVDTWSSASPSQALTISLDRAGYWPSPGIFWLGTGADTADIAALAGKLGSIGQGFGARRERRTFVPHVTLYRRCATPPPAPMREAQIRLQLDEITLFETQPGRAAVSYQPLAAWPVNFPSVTGGSTPR